MTASRPAELTREFDVFRDGPVDVARCRRAVKALAARADSDREPFTGVNRHGLKR